MTQTANSGSAAASTRERIKAVATEHFVTLGHEGFSFGDVAAAVGVTRANIHHHFGSKRKLMAELIADIAANAQTRIRRHWLAGDLTFAERLALQRDDLRAFHRRFNPAPGDRRMWSPLSRLRHDLAVLGDDAGAALEKVNAAYDDALQVALRKAVEAGEFRSDLPVEDVARLLRVSFLAWPPLTQDSAGFDEIDAMFAVVERTLRAAWGGTDALPR